MCVTDGCDVVCGTSFLAARLRTFFTEERVRTILLPLIDQSSVLSLRTLDWLVVNYSKKNNVVCTTKEGKLFNIFNGYKISLGVYRRRHFDPFRRRERHVFHVDGKRYDTTLGQVNFVHWCARTIPAPPHTLPPLSLSLVPLISPPPSSPLARATGRGSTVCSTTRCKTSRPSRRT